MGKHKELQDIILNELVIEEERAFRANRIIQHQEKLIENLERLLHTSSHTKRNVDTKDRKLQTDQDQVELVNPDSSSYASFVRVKDHIAKCLKSSESSEETVHFRKKKKSRKMRIKKELPKVFSCQMQSTSTSQIPEYSQSEKTDITVHTKSTQSEKSLCEEKSQKRLAANVASQKASKNQICRNEMKNASGENARAREDSMARLVGLLQPVVCQEESSRVIRSHQRTSHSIVKKPPNSKDILKLFERIEIRLRNLQNEIVNARRDVATDNSRVQVIQNQIENMRQEGMSTNDLMMRLLHLRTQLENSVNELNWKIKGNCRFRDDISRERWMTARKYFTAEQAYFLLTSAED